MKLFNILDPSLPIHQHTLIEASAGTGKTFSMEHLFVRLLLEDKSEAPLRLDQILVVTFTRAATKELRKRIRSTLEECLLITKLFLEEGELLGEKAQKFPYLPSRLSESDWVARRVKGNLEQALNQFDEASIYTIHSFCHRMLKDEFLGNNGLFSSKNSACLQPSDLIAMIKDFFRTELHEKNYNRIQLKILLKSFHSDFTLFLENLLKETRKKHLFLQLRDFSTLFLLFKEEMFQLKAKYGLESQKILEDFTTLAPFYTGVMNKQKGIHKEIYEKIKRFAALFDKRELEENDFECLLEDGLIWSHCFDEKKKRKRVALDTSTLHYKDLLRLFENGLSLLIKEGGNAHLLLKRLAYDCRKTLDHMMEERDLVTQDGLLELMLAATQKETFVSSVRKKFQAAIIDEFQDTDPLQWEIFQRLFLNDWEGHLYLVGDPKQSIYAFRDSDIYTYKKAAHLIGEAGKASLTTNFRSEPSLIRALNTLFSKENCPVLFELPKSEEKVFYHEVKAGKEEKNRGFLDEYGSLHFFLAKQSRTSRSFPSQDTEERFLFPFIANEISRLNRLENISYCQCAVLVRDRYQAKRLQEALKIVKIPSFCLKSETLANSKVVKEVIVLLRATHSPRNKSFILRALSGSLLGWTDESIRSLIANSEDERSDLTRIMFQFQKLRKLFVTGGFGLFIDAILRSAFKDSQKSVMEEILSREDGEEIYTDLMQISDCIIDEEKKSLFTLEQVIHFLENLSSLELNDDERLKRRYDPQREGVNILTLHMSKGLEYDVVFALGVASRTKGYEEEEEIQGLFEEATNDLVCQEIDAEKMRLLYVGMTRAKLRLYVPLVFPNSPKELAFGTASPIELFFAKLRSPPLSYPALYKAIRDFNEDVFFEKMLAFQEEKSLSYAFIPESVSVEVSNQPIEKVLTPPRESPKLLSETYYIDSYTRLKGISIPWEDEGLEASVKLSFISQIAEKSPFTLPSGKDVGILLHALLAKLPIECIKGENAQQNIRLWVEKELKGSSMFDWYQVISEMFYQTFQSVLPTGFSLSAVDFNQCYREMPFIYPWKDIKIPEEMKRVKNFLQGSMDLCFQHDGKYYLVDWKTNWLGNSLDDYREDGLLKAMRGHDYFLQASIYSEALRRYLAMVDCRPFEGCLGGAIYLFLRGIDFREASFSGVYHFFPDQGKFSCPKNWIEKTKALSL